MAFRSVGTNLSRLYIDGVSGLAEDLEALKRAGPDFVEVWPQNLGVIPAVAWMRTGCGRLGSCCWRRSWRTRSTPRSRSTSWT